MKVYRSLLAKLYFKHRGLHTKQKPVKDIKDAYPLIMKDGTKIPLKIIR